MKTLMGFTLMLLGVRWRHGRWTQGTDEIPDHVVVGWLMLLWFMVVTSGAVVIIWILNSITR